MSTCRSREWRMHGQLARYLAGFTQVTGSGGSKGLFTAMSSLGFGARWGNFSASAFFPFLGKNNVILISFKFQSRNKQKKKKWDYNSFLKIVASSESFPGPESINATAMASKARSSS